MHVRPRTFVAPLALVAMIGASIATGTAMGTATTNGYGATAAPLSNASLACAWPVESTPAKANVAYPDSNATYWTTPYVAAPGMTITIAGNYPTARFFSIDTYASNAQSFSLNGVGSALSDFQINPDAGSANGWQTPGAANGGAYTVTLTNDVAAGMPNVIPLAPATPTTPLLKAMPATTGFVMVRVYLPQGGNADNPAVVPLPTMTINTPGAAPRVLTPCANSQKAPSKASKVVKKAIGVIANAILGATGKFAGPPPCTTNCTAQLQFSRAGGTTTPFPNAASGYAAALYTPAKGYLTVMRATMPLSATATGSAPAVWPTATNQALWPSPTLDLRYWSVCNYIYKVPYPVVKVGKKMGCIADQAVTLSGSAGNVANVVLSSPTDRPAATRKTGSPVAWLPTSVSNTTSQEVIAIRNMLPNSQPAPGFANSVTNVTTYNDAAAAQAVMQQYYPTAVQCTTATFRRGVARGGALGGANACFNNPVTPRT